MDRTVVQTVQNSLIDSRSQVAYQFQQLTKQVSREIFTNFLMVYCQQEALLAEGLYQWNRDIAKIRAKLSGVALSALFEKMAEHCQIRQRALLLDQAALMQRYDHSVEERDNINPWQLIFQKCRDGKSLLTWLFIMTEIERLRIIHSFTLIKLCQWVCGKGVLRCLSHVLLQHREGNVLLDLSEKAIPLAIPLSCENPGIMINDIKLAMSTYAHSVNECYTTAVKRESYVK